MLTDAARAGVRTWVNVGFDPARWARTIDLARRFTGMHHMLGVHPGNADQWTPLVADDLQRLCASTEARAIGEIGIDLFRGETNLRAQLAAFDEQLDIALGLNLPAVIHMRNAERDVLDLLRDRSTNPLLLFHSFDGSLALRDFVLSCDSYIGVGGLATKTRSLDLQETLRTIPLGRMVLETDAPYLIPRRARGRFNVPSNIPVIAEFVAALQSDTLDRVAETTTRNAETIFGTMESA